MKFVKAQFQIKILSMPIARKQFFPRIATNPPLRRGLCLQTMVSEINSWVRRPYPQSCHQKMLFLNPNNRSQKLRMMLLLKKNTEAEEEQWSNWNNDELEKKPNMSEYFS